MPRKVYFPDGLRYRSLFGDTLITVGKEAVFDETRSPEYGGSMVFKDTDEVVWFNRIIWSFLQC